MIERYKRHGIRVFQTSHGPGKEDFSQPRFGDDHIVCTSNGAVEGVNCEYREQ